jgi:hypothetical protein
MKHTTQSVCVKRFMTTQTDQERTGIVTIGHSVGFRHHVKCGNSLE